MFVLLLLLLLLLILLVLLPVLLLFVQLVSAACTAVSAALLFSVLCAVSASLCSCCLCCCCFCCWLFAASAAGRRLLKNPPLPQNVCAAFVVALLLLLLLRLLLVRRPLNPTLYHKRNNIPNRKPRSPVPSGRLLVSLSLSPVHEHDGTQTLPQPYVIGCRENSGTMRDQKFGVGGNEKTNNHAGCKSGDCWNALQENCAPSSFSRMFSHEMRDWQHSPARPKEDPGPQPTLSRSLSPSLVRRSTLRTLVAPRPPCSKLSSFRDALGCWPHNSC